MPMLLFEAGCADSLSEKQGSCMFLRWERFSSAAMPQVSETRQRARSERPPGYGKWLAEVKARVHAAQQRAALAVNRELLMLYWQLGRDLLERQAQPSWGKGVIGQVSSDLRAAFPT